jgi:putative endonuclease
MYVYILRSGNNGEHYYVGMTKDLRQRLAEHNQGKSTFTSGKGPWKLKLAVWFLAQEKAIAFEKYLKSHSGRAFAKKHF